MSEHIKRKQEHYAGKIVEELQKHCEKWHYNWMEELRKEKTGITSKKFFQLFCRVTRTYYMELDGEAYYNVFFARDETVIIKRCGKDYDSRQPDAVISLQEVLKLLPWQTK